MKRAQQVGDRKKMEFGDFFGSNMFQMVRDAVDGVGGSR